MEHWLAELLDTLPTLLLFTVIAVSLFTLSKGADILVDEAVSLSLRWGIPKMIIGATIVSIGTTLPEASVSVAAAVTGDPDFALGNAVGSIICDTSLIIGIAALIRPLPVQRELTDRQAWIHLGSGLLLVAAALPWSSLGRGISSQGIVPQWMGFVFLALLVVYIYRTIVRARQNSNQLAVEAVHIDTGPLPSLIFRMVLALALIIVSSRVLIPTVQITAVRMGIPRSIIAATLVAFGTSLPELSTAISASRKGHGELAIGNVIGADILNVLFVVGSAAAVTPAGLTVPVNFTWFHFPVMITVLVLFRLFLLSKSRTVGRLMGTVLLLFYVFYVVASYTII